MPVLFAACASAQTADALRADVSFLASDALEGRGTPSPGLTIASEFIAAGFRRAGLEPAGDDGYFQTAAYLEVTPRLEGFELTLESAGQNIRLAPSAMSVQQPAAMEINRAAVWKTAAENVGRLSAEQVNGKVLVVEASTRRTRFALPPEVHPRLIIRLIANGQAGPGPRLREPGTADPVPTLLVWDREFERAVKAAKQDAVISARLAAPVQAPAKLRNIIGLLRGSDPTLNQTYLIVSAHYDHLGVRGTGPGDHIFNGANDDASGIASIMEIALALAARPERPRRSIVFLAFFGEELGEVGSRDYIRHPVFSLTQTIADINLEQLGRTDGTTGRHLGTFNLTGFDFTDLARTMRRAASGTGIRVQKDEENSDRYFTASDNYPFAEAGIPDTTASVTYDFPDYHGAGDEWAKLDYDNMAKVDRVLAAAILTLANSDSVPQWNASDPNVAAFIKARGKQ